MNYKKIIGYLLILSPFITMFTWLEFENFYVFKCFAAGFLITIIIGIGTLLIID